MPINSFLYPGPTNSNPYVVDNSCRFNDGDSPQMNKTISSTSTTWTFSCWIKHNPTGTNQYLASWDMGGGESLGIGIENTGASTQLFIYTSSTGQAPKLYDGKLRDPSAWRNIVIKNSSGTITSYINGTQANTSITGTALASGTLRIGCWTGSNYFFDGYMAEVVLIDGTAYAASSFGEFDEDSPTIWKPKDVSGLTFGSDGFYLDFKDSANLGNDQNGGTDLTEANLAAADQATDTPTNSFATLNSLDNYYNASTFSEGNLQIATHASNEAYNTGTIGVTSGKWYWEVKISASQDREFIGISDRPAGASDFTAWTGANGSVAYYSNSGDYRKGSAGSNTSYGDSHGVNDIVGIALDVDNMKLYFSKNGTWQNSGDPTSGATGTGAISLNTPIVGDGFLYPAVGEIYTGSSTFQLNFGGCPAFTISSGNADGNGYGNFEYSVPSGYYSLCTKNLAEFG